MSAISHSLLGWHRGVVLDGGRVSQWLEERRQAVEEAFARIPGGNNVAQYMADHGWLSFCTQIRAVKTKPIKVCALKNYEVIILRVSLQYQNSAKVALGLIDRGLNVKSIMLATPEMSVAQGLSDGPLRYEDITTHPSCFYIGDGFRTELEELSTRIYTLLLQESLSLSAGMGEPQLPPVIRGRTDILGGKTCLITRNDTYPKFYENRKPMPASRIIFRGARVRAVLFVPHLSLNLSVYRHFEISYKRFLMQLMELSRKKPKNTCLFTDDDDE